MQPSAQDQVFVLTVQFVTLFVVAIPVLAGLVVGAARVAHEFALARAVLFSTLFASTIALGHVVYDLGDASRGWLGWVLGPLDFVLGLNCLLGFGHALGSAISCWKSAGRQTLVPLAVYGAAGLVFWGSPHVMIALSDHSDAAMIENFRRHESEFERLAVMFEQDKPMNLMCRTENGYRASRSDLSPERLQEYDALLETIGVRYGLTREPRGQVLFRVWVLSASGFADQNIEKGYAFIEGTPERQRESLDVLRGLGEGITYRHVSGKWHLYYYNRDSLRSTCDLRGW